MSLIFNETTKENVVTIDTDTANKDFFPATLQFNTIKEPIKIGYIVEPLKINVISDNLYSDNYGVKTIVKTKPTMFEISIIANAFGFSEIKNEYLQNQVCLTFLKNSQFNPLYGFINDFCYEQNIIKIKNYINITFVGSVVPFELNIGEIFKEENSNEKIKEKIRKINRRFTF
jgi:hypothetical protein